MFGIYANWMQWLYGRAISLNSWTQTRRALDPFAHRGVWGHTQPENGQILKSMRCTLLHFELQISII